VAEAIVVHELLDEGLTHREIRDVIARLRHEFGDWPLTIAPLAIGTQESAGEKHPASWKHLLLVREEGAYEAQTSVAKLQHVAQDLQRGGWFARRIPNLQHVEVNPDRLSGAPTIRGRRVPVERVARTAMQPGGMKLLLDEYSLLPEEIDDAVRWWKAAEALETAAA
jgi:uncharacterized protein (DUF433 family)